MTSEVNKSVPTAAAAAVLETSGSILADFVLNSSLKVAGGEDSAEAGEMAGVTKGNLTHINSEQVEGETVPCGLFFIIIYGPLYIVVCIFGLVGNSLSFAVLHGYSRSNVATFLLKALAVSDNLFLVTALFVQTLTAMLLSFGKKEVLLPIYPYIQTYVWPATHMIQMGTVWMMVLIATNRYIAVCKPLHAPRLCRKRNVKVQILIMTVFIIAYNIPRFFEYKYTYVNVTTTENTTETNEVNIGLQSKVIYNILYENVSYCLFVFLIPLIVLVVLNVHLVRELKSAQKSREALTSRTSTEENNITLVMIVIILVFIVCQTPSALNQILYYIVDDKLKETCSHYMKYYHICNLLIIMNSSMNFVIYCVFRRQFQQDLWALFRGKPPRQRSSTIKRMHTNSFRSSTQVVKSSHMQESVPLTSSTACTEPGGNDVTTPTTGDGALLNNEDNHVNNVTQHGNNHSNRWS